MNVKIYRNIFLSENIPENEKLYLFFILFTSAFTAIKYKAECNQINDQFCQLESVMMCVLSKYFA